MYIYMYIHIFIYSFNHLLFLFIYVFSYLFIERIYIYLLIYTRYIDIFQVVVPGPCRCGSFEKRKLALRNQLPSGQKPFVVWTAGCPLEASDYRQYAMFHLRKLKARWRQTGSAWEPIQDQFTLFSKVNPYWNDFCCYCCYHMLLLYISTYHCYCCL